VAEMTAIAVAARALAASPEAAWRRLLLLLLLLWLLLLLLWLLLLLLWLLLLLVVVGRGEGVPLDGLQHGVRGEGVQVTGLRADRGASEAPRLCLLLRVLAPLSRAGVLVGSCEAHEVGVCHSIL